jgi:DNA-binding HxlR family transcriptional regulator
MERCRLYQLMERTLCFNALCRKLPSVTQRMLTEQLRELEEHGLISGVPRASTMP